jgi:tetratricopeptide (TPR) repeat protein
MFGMWAGGHHATSVVLHILNSILLFTILRRMTGAFWRSAMVAALFAWHPLHVESVAWVAERKDVLSTLFWMLTVWAYLRYAEECKAQTTKCKRFYMLALFCFACGLMAKPMLVTLPFVLLLLDWWPLGRLQLGSPNPNLNPNLNLNPAGSRVSDEGFRRRDADGCGRDDRAPKNVRASPGASRAAVLRLFMEKVPFLVMAAIACFVTLRVAAGSAISYDRLPLAARLSNALFSYVRYIEKMVLPYNLVVVYPFDFREVDRVLVLSVLFLAAVSVAALLFWKTRPYWLTGWLFYLGVLVPVIGLVQVGAQPMADRYTYLPSVGIFLMVCWFVCDLVAGLRHGRALLAAAAVAVLAACFILSGKQLQYWKTSRALFLHNIAVTPDNAVARANYAIFLCDDQQWEQAVRECKAVLRLSPDYAFPHHVLGKALFLQGKLDEALPELHEALRLDPNNYLVHLLLGRIALRKNSPAEAASYASIVLAADSTNPEAHCILGEALGAQGKLDQAAAQFTEALRLVREYPDAHHQLAVTLAMQHQSRAAISHYRAALALQPDRPDTLNNLAWLLATDPLPENRDGAEAVRLATRLCELTGRQEPFFLGTLAAAYAEAGRYDEAVAAAQQAHDLAEEKGLSTVAARNLELLGIYRSRQPFHEK